MQKLKKILGVILCFLIIAYGFYSMQDDEPTYPIHGKVTDNNE